MARPSPRAPSAHLTKREVISLALVAILALNTVLATPNAGPTTFGPGGTSGDDAHYNTTRADYYSSAPTGYFPTIAANTSVTSPLATFTTTHAGALDYTTATGVATDLTGHSSAPTGYFPNLVVNTSFIAPGFTGVNATFQSAQVTNTLNVSETRSSSLELGWTNTSGNYTITERDSIVAVNASLGNITLTLPSATNEAGRLLVLRRTDFTPSTLVTVSPAVGQSLDRTVALFLRNQGQTIILHSDGSNWQQDSTTPTDRSATDNAEAYAYTAVLIDNMQTGWTRLGTGTATLDGPTYHGLTSLRSNASISDQYSGVTKTFITPIDFTNKTPSVALNLLNVNWSNPLVFRVRLFDASNNEDRFMTQITATSLGVWQRHDVGRNTTVGNFNASAVTKITIDWYTGGLYIGDLAIGDIRAINVPDRAYAVITFDDNWMNEYTTAYPLMAKYGYPGTIMVNPGKVGAQSYYMGNNELQTLYNAGWDLGNHGYQHLHNEATDNATQRDNIEQGKRWLIDHGYTRAADIYRAPFSEEGNGTRAALTGLASMAVFGVPRQGIYNEIAGQGYRITDPLHVMAMGGDDYNVTLADIDHAVVNRSLYFVTFHNITDTNLFESVLKKIKDYENQSKISVITPSQLLRRLDAITYPQPNATASTPSNVATLNAAGSVVQPPSTLGPSTAAKTSDYTITPTDHLVVANGGITLTLGTGFDDGHPIIIKRADSTSSPLLVTGSIEGATITRSLKVNAQTLALEYDANAATWRYTTPRPIAQFQADPTATFTSPGGSANTRYFGLSGSGMGTGSTSSQHMLMTNATVTGFQIRPITNGLASGETITVTFRKNGVDTALSTTITDTSVNPTTAWITITGQTPIDFSYGDVWDYKAVPNTLAANRVMTFMVDTQVVWT